MRKGNNMLKKLIAAAALMPALAFASLDVKIDASKTHQKIDNFAAADAWSGQFVGQYFNDAQKGQVAKWLF